MHQKDSYIIELNGVCKSFPGVKALDQAHLKVRKGTVHALCGENGAGKSTLIKIINGIYKADEGEIVYKGKKITPQNPKQMLDMGISTIHQELSPVLEMTVAENIFLGREPKHASRFLNVKKMYADTQELMNQFGFSYNPHAKLKELSISDMQLLEIVKAISCGASLIIMDEPTSSITEKETELLFENIRKLRSEGISIIYISHKMDEIFGICDEVTIFRDGKWVDTKSIEKIDRKTIIERMVGREITDVYPKEQVPIGGIELEVKHLSSKKFQDIGFYVRRGEILGFSGLVGAGRTEVFRAVFGLDPYESGEILLEGKPIENKTVKDAIENHIVMASEDRKGEGLILCRSIKENIALTNLKILKKGGFLDVKKEAAVAQEMTDKMSVKMASLNAPCASLSGGNQQKIVLSKWLVQNPKVLILDEPTRGIDVGAKYEIYKLICKLAKEGISIIIISSEMPELLGMCDRIMVMSCGQITGELNREDFSQNEIMTLSMKGFENE